MKNLSLFLIVILSIFFWALTFAENYSQEFQDAYNFAYKNKITTIKSIDDADMNWWLTRIAMAKMLSQYAINILWKTPDTSRKANFGDVSTQLDEQYNNGVTLAYQLWIMGVWITKFRPYDKVTRAEFGTALSRVLFWDIYNQEGNNYYSKHLFALQIAWIMTKIDNPSKWEVRWYVMIMLMRSDKSYGHWNSNNTNNKPNENPIITPNQNSNKTWDNKPNTWNNKISTWNNTSSWGWWWGGWGWWWGGWGWWWSSWGWWSGSSSTTTTTWYTVTWLSWDWTILEIDKNVTKGSFPEYNWASPTFEENWVTYDFIWWEPELSTVNWDVTYQAKPSNLLKDKENRLNIVLIWYWWNNYEWYFLIPDSISVASWDLNTNDVTLISLPYNGYYENYKQNLSRYFDYSHKDNQTVEILADDIKKWTSKILWVDIQHYATMNFDAFREVIDILGWIDVVVDNPIVDPNYPNSSLNWYEAFSISNWTQHLDWETALKYVRSVNSTSDSDRAYRQQKIILAIKEKFKNSSIDLLQIYNLYKIYDKKIESDIWLFDFIWAVRNVNKINKIYSYEYNSKVIYDKFEWVINDINNDINIFSFKITWESSYWKNFSNKSKTEVVPFELIIWNERIVWNMWCKIETNWTISCNTSDYDLSSITLKAWDTVKIWLITTRSPLIKRNLTSNYVIELKWKYLDWTLDNFNISLSEVNDGEPIWFSILHSCSRYESYVTLNLEKESDLVWLKSVLFDVYDPNWKKIEEFYLYDKNWNIITSSFDKYDENWQYIWNSMKNYARNIAWTSRLFTTIWRDIFPSAEWFIFNNYQIKPIPDSWLGFDIMVHRYFTPSNLGETEWYKIVVKEINWTKLDSYYTYDSCSNECNFECRFFDGCNGACYSIPSQNIWVLNTSSNLKIYWSNENTDLNKQVNIALKETKYVWRINFHVSYKKFDDDWIDLSLNDYSTYFSEQSSTRINWYYDMTSQDSGQVLLYNLFKFKENWHYKIYVIDSNNNENYLDFTVWTENTWTENTWTGNVYLSATASNNRKVIAWIVNDFDNLSFTFSEDNISITKITLERYWYSNNSAVENIWLEDEDWNIISNELILNSNSQATLTIKKDYRVNLRNATIVATISESDNSQTIWFRVIDVESTAMNLDLDNYSPSIYDIVRYDANEATVYIPSGNIKHVYNSNEEFDLATFDLKCNTRCVINWFSLTNNWNIDLADLDWFKVFIWNTQVYGLRYNIKSDNNLTLTFDDKNIDTSKITTIRVVGKVNNLNEYWKYLQLWSTTISDFKLIESKTSTRMSVKFEGTTWPKVYFVDSVPLISLELTNDINSEVYSYIWKSMTNTVLEWEFSVQWWTAYIDQIRITWRNPNNDVTFHVYANNNLIGDIDNNLLYKNIKLPIIKVNNWVSVPVKVTAEITWVQQETLEWYSLTLTLIDDDDCIISRVEREFTDIIVREEWYPQIFDITTTQNDVVLNKDNPLIAQFRIKPVVWWTTNPIEWIKLNELVFSSIWNNSLSKNDIIVNINWITQNSNSLTYKPGYELPTEWLPVEVYLKTPMRWTFQLKLNSINNKNEENIQRREFPKIYSEDALVKVSNQEKLWEYTKYTLAVSKISDDITVSDVKLRWNWILFASHTGEVDTSDTLEAVNMSTIKYIDKITYTVNFPNNYINDITINKTDFPNHFMIWNYELIVFQDSNSWWDNSWWNDTWWNDTWWNDTWWDSNWWNDTWWDDTWWNNSNEDLEDTEDCAYIKVDNWKSYCFNITKVSGSNFTMSINGDTEGVYWCSVTRVSDSNSSWVSNSCWIYSFTVLPSNWVTEFFLRLSYDSKQYTKRVSYDLTNWIFVYD